MGPLCEATRPLLEGVTRTPQMSDHGLYTLLPANTIRLLRLSQTETSNLEGDLVLVALADCPEYTALSYTWGEKQGSEIELSKKQTLSLSRNLSLALKNLISGSEGDPPLLWIDQICINQQDEREVRRQIEMMWEIYTEATEVMVWLGAESEIENLAQLTWAVECLQSYDGDPSVEPMREFLAGHAKKAKSFGANHSLGVKRSRQSSLAEEGFFGLLSLWSRPWFERLWVRQEVTLAKSVVFHCGSNTLSAAKLARACEFQLQAAGNVLSDQMDGEWTKWARKTAKSCSQIACAYELFELIKSTEPQRIYERPDLLDVFRYNFDLKAEKGPDRLYAIYHLSSAATQGRFSPVNTSTIEQLWRELAVYLLNDVVTWNKLHDTCNAQRPRKVAVATRKARTTTVTALKAIDSSDGPACPAVVLALSCTQNNTTYQRPLSWIPQFDKLGFHSAHKFDHYFHYSRQFAAGGKGRFNPIFDQKDNLSVEGIVLSHVVSVIADTQQPSLGELAPLEFESEEYWSFIREELVPWYLKCYTHTRKPRPVDFAKLLRQGIDNRWDKKSQPVRSGTNKPNRATFLDHADPISLQDVNGKDMYNNLLPFIVRDAWRVDTRDRRRILAFLDNGGKRMGWVPESTLAGDSVLLISGAPFPFVVREGSGEDRGLYYIIGDAYFEGLQDGSVWERNKSRIARVAIR
jgi:hypothetical protein